MLAKKRDPNNSSQNNAAASTGAAKEQAASTSGAAPQDAGAGALESLRGSLPAVPAKAPAAEPKTPSDALAAEFDIRLPEKTRYKIILSVPVGSSFYAALEKLAAAATELHGRPAIDPVRMKEWANNRLFTEVQRYGHSIAVDGNVASSTLKTASEQASRGWNKVTEPELAVAHAAYFLRRGKDLFGGNVCRCDGPSLYFFESGLDYRANLDTRALKYVAACQRIDPRLFR